MAGVREQGKNETITRQKRDVIKTRTSRGVINNEMRTRWERDEMKRDWYVNETRTGKRGKNEMRTRRKRGENEMRRKRRTRWENEKRTRRERDENETRTRKEWDQNETRTKRGRDVSEMRTRWERDKTRLIRGENETRTKQERDMIEKRTRWDWSDNETRKSIYLHADRTNPKIFFTPNSSPYTPIITWCSEQMNSSITVFFGFDVGRHFLYDDGGFHGALSSIACGRARKRSRRACRLRWSHINQFLF